MGRAKTDKGEEKRRRRRRRKRREEKKEERRRKEDQRYGSLVFFCMDAMEFVWIYDFVWKNQNINPFLMNLGLKEPYLVYWQF